MTYCRGGVKKICNEYKGSEVYIENVIKYKGAGKYTEMGIFNSVGKSGEMSTKVLKVKRKCGEIGTNVLEDTVEEHVVKMGTIVFFKSL